MGNPLESRVKRPDQLVQLAEYVQQLRFEDLDAETIATAKNFIMDCIAVGVAGCSYDATDKALLAASKWGDGSTRVLGRKDTTLAAPAAAFVNGMQIHCLEWDGLHEPTVVIALCAPMGALVAEMDNRPVSGKALITAFVAAVEVAVFFGGNKHIGPRFFRPSVAGTFGAAAGIAKLRNMDTDGIVQTLGLAYSQTSGTMQAHWEGSMALPMQVGAASRSGMTSADMAEAGMTGTIDFISGEFGFFKLFETEVDADSRLKALHAPAKILEVAHKPFPAGRATQAVLTMWKSLTDQQAIPAESIKKITVYVPSLIELLVGRPAYPEMPPSYARLCLRFVIPLMITEKRIDPRLFNADTFARQDLVELGGRIEIINDGNPDKNALGPQRMIVELTNGEQLSADCKDPLGSPDNPLDEKGRNNKVVECLSLANHSIDAAALIALCQSLELTEDCTDLLDLLC